MKYRTRKLRKAGTSYLLWLTNEEREYLQRTVVDRGGNMALIIRGKTFPKGWRRRLDDLRQSQGPLVKTAPV